MTHCELHFFVGRSENQSVFLIAQAFLQKKKKKIRNERPNYGLWRGQNGLSHFRKLLFIWELFIIHHLGKKVCDNYINSIVLKFPLNKYHIAFFKSWVTVGLEMQLSWQSDYLAWSPGFNSHKHINWVWRPLPTPQHQFETKAGYRRPCFQIKI